MSDDRAIVLDGAWKRFRKGHSHDSLRDLIPATLRRLLGRQPGEDNRWFWALREVSFEVARGEAVGIIGPNGAGKSTILKILSKILRPDRGHVQVRGRLSSLIEIGAGFHLDLTGRENIYLNGAILGMAQREMDRKFDAIVEFAELAEFIDTPIKRYSSGMQARLGFSVAAHMDPDVLLVDEVLSVGDMSFQNRCLEKMAEFQRQGTTIVFVSHNLQAVARTCERVIVLDGGSVAVDAPPAQAINEYLRTTSRPRNSGLTASRRAEIGRAALVRPDGTDSGPVVPGVPLHLRVPCRFLDHVDKVTFGFALTRAVDNMTVYSANVSELGIAPLDVRPGMEVELAFDFATHLTRGVYCLTVHAKTLSDQSYLDFAQGCAVFEVRENVSYEGVADIGLQFRCGSHEDGAHRQVDGNTQEAHQGVGVA